MSKKSKGGGEQSPPAQTEPLEPEEELAPEVSESASGEEPAGTDEPEESSEEPLKEPPKSLADIARADMRRAEKLEARHREAHAKRAEADEAKRRAQHEAKLDALFDRADSINRDRQKKGLPPENFRVFRVDPDQPANAVVRGRCHKPGEMFLATKDEVRRIENVDLLA